jgi:hypothetical protein
VDKVSDLCVYPRRLIPRRKERVNYDLRAANGTIIHTYEWLPLNLNLGLCRDFTLRFVMDDVTHPLIGVDFLSHFGLLVDCRNNRLLDGVTSLFVPAQAAASLILSVTTITGGTAVQSPRRIPGLHSPRRSPAVAKAEFHAMLRDSTASLSESSWSSVLHIVPKDNGWHPCGDYRALNAPIIPDRYPVRHIHDDSYQLSGCSVFSKIDLVRAYNKIPVHPDDI